MKKTQTAVALLCAALAVAGCSKKGQETLNIFCWSEYIPQEIVDGFAAETGIKVNVENYSSNEELLAKLKAGATKYDLIQPSEYVVERLAKAGELRELDHGNIPNLGNLLPEYRSFAFDPGNKFSVPWMIGTVGIVVNTGKISSEVKGFADVFQPEHKGRIVAVDDAREMVAWAFTTLGIPINDITPENLERARPILASWLPLIKAFDSDSPKDKLLAGDVDIGIVWSGEAAYCWQEDKKFAYVLPAEGAHMFVDNLAIPKTAPNASAAEKFINYILRPEVSAKISSEFPYTNPNGAARRLLSAEQLANPASYPPDAPTEIFHDIGERAEAVDKLMTDLRSAY